MDTWFDFDPEEDRPSWDAFFMEKAMVTAKRSTCCKWHTGCVIVNAENHMVSDGYNGTAHGCEHCTDYWRRHCPDHLTFKEYLQTDEFRRDHREFAHDNEIHAEINAILRASPEELRGSTLYTLLSPCTNCAKTIVQCRIARVVYVKLKYQNAVEYLERCGVETCDHSSQYGILRS